MFFFQQICAAYFSSTCRHSLDKTIRNVGLEMSSPDFDYIHAENPPPLVTALLLTNMCYIVSIILFFLLIAQHCEKYRNFHLISWCGDFVERHSFCIVSGDLPETMRKLCLSTTFPHQEIRWKLRYFLQCKTLINIGLLTPCLLQILITYIRSTVDFVISEQSRHSKIFVRTHNRNAIPDYCF